MAAPSLPEIRVTSPRSCLAIGLNSGTSMDGVDAVLLKISEARCGHSDELNFEQVKSITHPYPKGLKTELLHLSTEGKVHQICSYNVLLGKIFADAAKAVVKEAGLDMHQVEIIGSHGQTIFHSPSAQNMFGYSVSSTLQIGDPSVIANKCGVTTVGDFRMADISVGGQGAPLMPYLDRIVLERHFKKSGGRVGVMLNIGGISNIAAVVPDGGKRKLIGFDCGPGNMLMDCLAQKLFKMEYDEDGNIAESGSSAAVLLEHLFKDDNFVSRVPPKSTGREYYGQEYVERVLSYCKELQLSSEDCMATLTDFTAAAVAVNFDAHVRKYFRVEEEFDLFVSGGGARNKTLMKFLRKRLKSVRVCTTEELGIDPDAKEAILFAVLAYQTARGRPTGVPNVTGASSSVVQGKVCLIRSDGAPSE